MNKQNKREKFCSMSKFNKYTLLKNPIKGGTPAKENRKSVRKNK